MKKLSLLFLTLYVSLAGWAATLNPYAYNLSSTWNEATQELTVRFKLNAHPNMGGSKSGKGIQIFAIDPSDNNKQYYIYGVPGNIINEKIAANSLDYELTIPITGVTWNGADVLPAGKNLTWAVTVQGLNSKDQASPVVVNDNIANRPYSPHGIAVNNDQNSPDFGSIYVTECTDGVSGNATWGWLSSAKGRSLLKYDPTLKYQTSYRKHKEGDPTKELFSSRNVAACFLEPHRVCVSDDGRVFVSSYNRNTRDDQIAVWEFKNGVFVPVIYHNTYGGAQGVYGDRVCGMAVKGSGNNLRILLCFLDEYDGNYANAFRMYEYDLNNLGAKNNEGSWRCSYRPSGNTYEYDGSTGSAQGALDAARTNKWYFYSDGFANIAYGGKNKNDVFLSIDYCIGSTYNASIVYFKEGATSSTSIQNVNTTNHYYGGAGFIPLVDGNNEYIISGRTKYHGFGDGTNTESSGYIHAYPMSGTTISTSPKSGYTLSNINTGTVINDMAMDRANNLYVVSFKDETGQVVGTGRLIAIAMPYGGATMTMAPSTNADANRYFNVKPVPNILATDLRCEPHATQNRYIFSFNTNTKPEEAQIRFYYSYEDMQKSLNVVNADNYNGTNANKPAFVYNIPDDRLKQGRIEVELGGVCGKLDANNVIINDSLPAGVLYWSVYVKTRESSAFAPIYKQSTAGEDAHHRLHATVNNYPETDGFGHIYAVNYYAEFDSRNGLMEYSFNPNGNSIDDQNNIENSNRYKLVKNYLNPSGNKPKFTNQRRLAVAPDGKVYIADCGQSLAFDADADRPWMFQGGGVFVWNPNTQTGNEIQISLFSTKDLNSTATAVDIYNHDGQLKLYATNTYGEFENHFTHKHYWKGYEYTEDNQKNTSRYGWNGFKEFNLGTPDNILLEETNGTVLHSLGMGDGNGNIGIVATDKGIWLAQHRLNDVQYTIDQFTAKPATQPALPDNTENYILSFVPYGNNTRTWTSCTTRGINYDGNKYDQKGASELTQLPSSPLQACPGAGLAYRKTKGKEYLYIVNHQGNIVELQITSWDGTKPSVQYTKTYPGAGPKDFFQNTGRKQGVINTMCFDYAGNLITTSGLEYLGSASNQNIIVYTMPYDRVNAREIQAPNSCRMIPERIAHLDMGARELDLVIKGHQGHEGCAIDLYRPLQGAMFNTICLPFELNLGSLPADHPLKNAKLQAYTELKLETVGGEKMLELVFTDVNDNIIRANTPYIIRPENDEGINHIIRFDGPLVLTNITGNAVQKTEAGGTYSITYRGIVPFQLVQPTFQDGESLTLMLVAGNRLAEMTAQGNMLGFRGYFQLNTPLPRGMQTRITTQKPVATNTTIVVDGKKVNVEKFLREGRVCIRVGETLYNMNGEIIER